MRHASLVVAALLLAACAPDYELGSTQPSARPGHGDPPTQPGPFDTDGDGFIDGDHFDLTAPIPVDIAIYGDTSNSMVDELVTLGQNVLTFTDRLERAGADWRMIAVTGPDGCGVDGIFTSNSQSFDARFAAAIVTPASDPNQDEMGLQNVRNAVEQADGGCNDGWLRSNALLHVIFISDENDESPGFDTAGYWQSYIDQIVAEKGSSALVRFSAVAGPVPDGCGGADPGDGYADVVDATGGEFVSICDDWPSELDTLADASVITDTFPLSSVPIPETIEPWVNGQQRTSGWTFDDGANAVVFTQNPPVSGDLVDIYYDPL